MPVPCLHVPRNHSQARRLEWYFGVDREINRVKISLKSDISQCFLCHASYFKMKKDRKETTVTIVCAIFVAITSILAAFVAREKITAYEYKEIPGYDFITTTDYFPLAVGNYWTYEGIATTTLVGGKLIEKKVQLTIKVVDAIKEGDVVLFILSGHPSDVAWALKEKNLKDKVTQISPSKYGYLVIANKVYFVEQDKISKVIASIKDSGHLDSELITQSDLEFEFPLFKGQRYGEISQIPRKDLAYFWYVDDYVSHHQIETTSFRSLPEYELVYNTGPDFASLTFSPFLGIISYKYSHHGTKVEVNISLTSYKIHLDGGK